MQTHHDYMLMAIDEARRGMKANEGGPFGAVIVKEGTVIGKGNNRVLMSNDPTAHAEMLAIREACAHLGHFQLDQCTLYTTCEPCPMCLGAIYWARPEQVYYGSTRFDAAAIGFDDAFIYEEILKPPDGRKITMLQLPNTQLLALFREWLAKSDRTGY